ncbi:Stage II sporulation protein E (SpoIIE) [Pirellulimonas nuda]|uniref:Stage II sporulation protein E (SpoIIE) n=1 Tax=Pirellulimonas nuda TaxID=2528009 RepID=A0A518DJV1_9BACT|nr:SpoIIE family protein phosphatase [Pirellulimonas nuda]QDU91753.1 Stage II sporulation protein E (SpoIIE) [Pirellulimonas nuda]
MDLTTTAFDPPTLPFSLRAADPAPPVRREDALSTPLSRNDPSHAETRLAAVMRGAANGFHADRAELWLVDHTNRRLDLAQWHSKSAPRFQQRTLALAAADVAAMAGGAVVLEDRAMLREWVMADGRQAAVCVPVASDATIHGTLWISWNTPRAIPDEQVELIEIVGGRLAVELERGVGGDPTAGAIWLPNRPLAEEELDLCGRTDQSLADRSFYDWQMLAGGRMLAVAGCVADGAGAQAGLQRLVAHAARIALRAHADHAATAAELLSAANRTVWQASPGGEGAAVSVALIDSEAWQVSCATAGPTLALRTRTGSIEPLGTEAPPLGWDDQAEFITTHCELGVRESLTLAAGGASLTRPGVMRGVLADHNRLPLEARRTSSASRRLSLLWDAIGGDLQSALVIRRR